MKITFNIYNAILFGALRPWIKDNKNETKFKTILNNKVRVNKDNLNKFFKSVSEALKEYSVLLDFNFPPIIYSESDGYNSNQNIDNQYITENLSEFLTQKKHPKHWL